MSLHWFFDLCPVRSGNLSVKGCTMGFSVELSLYVSIHEGEVPCQKRSPTLCPTPSTNHSNLVPVQWTRESEFYFNSRVRFL